MSNRLDRANALIMKNLTNIIQGLNDPRLSGEILSVTDVDVAPDFSFCKVMVSVLNANSRDIVLKILKKSSGYIKRRLSQELDLPQIPELKFVMDIGYDNTKRINEILETLYIPEEEEDEI